MRRKRIRPRPQQYAHRTSPHRIIPRHDNTGAIAICRYLLPNCPDIQLTPEQSNVLQVDRPRLGRALARALGCQPVQASIGALHTEQIGSWSRDAVPVFLTIQNTRRGFHQAVTHLAAVLRDKFILLTPTKDLLTALTQQIVAAHGAAIFDLASTVDLTTHGSLYPVRTPGELFIKFNPQIKQLDQSVAERAFALIRQLDSDLNQKPPSAITVFRLYCIEELAAQTIADRCHCSKATILNRLATIRHKTGIQDLRRYSQHLESVAPDTSRHFGDTDHEPGDNEQ